MVLKFNIGIIGTLVLFADESRNIINLVVGGVSLAFMLTHFARNNGFQAKT